MARRKYLSAAELAEFDRATELADLRDPSPIRLDDGRWFLQHDYAPAGYGWYFTNYDPETREGKGWFGTEDHQSYAFEDELREDEYGDLVLMSRNCGYGEGCFWSEWR